MNTRHRTVGWMPVAAVLTLVVVLLIAVGTGSLPGKAEGHPEDSGREVGKKVDVLPYYSKSGYDLTRLSPERIAEIAETLTPEQRRITQEAGTEAPFCGNLTDNLQPGIYVSVVGGLPLFKSTGKFISKSGWASFFEPFDPDHIIEREDGTHGMARVEILDARSGAHLGHVFDDGPPPTGKRYCVNSAALHFVPEGEELPPESRPVALETAYFAGGCFWGIEDKLAKIEGVVEAESGYQGGEADAPDYRLVCSGTSGHAETVRVVFDSNRVSYWKLLGAFFSMHDPTTANRQGPDVGSQYRSAIFTTSTEQADAARTFIRDLETSGRFGDRPIVTKVEDAPEFYAAEEYHQDYYVRRGGSCGY
ncbi:bifunctional methionine sulfoxide reductase B/A protein [Candidatus Eisenbacteria bacterium]|uniref:Peptide methionine sulfoxide reductase MsrA n=1 Tax=Eiseniibacteriota bacterium TaxID=2212470 RepID=A0ABV6YJ10_UNCEI